MHALNTLHRLNNRPDFQLHDGTSPALLVPVSPAGRRWTREFIEPNSDFRLRGEAIVVPPYQRDYLVLAIAYAGLEIVS